MNISASNLIHGDDGEFVESPTRSNSRRTGRNVLSFFVRH